jgi:hypothetical protein
MVAAVDQQRPLNNIAPNNDDSDESLRSGNDGDDDVDDGNHSMTQAAAMAATRTMRAEDGPHRRTHDTTTAAERAIMGTIDPDENVADFIFQDENGQLVQQRFLQFLNT